MYRVIQQLPSGGFRILTRSKRYNGFSNEPVFTADAADKRINEYETKNGALKAAWKLRKARYDCLVIDSSTGMEIPESKEARYAEG